MEEDKKHTRLGLFGRSLIITISVVMISSIIFFLYIFDFPPFSSSSSGKSVDVTKEDTSTELKEKVEKTQQTVGKSYEEIGVFVHDMHKFYNETTGYGKINSLDYEEQIKKAKSIDVFIEENVESIEDKQLKEDLKEIKMNTADLYDEQSKTHVKSLHRMFHDLDIALNDYQSFDKIWGVTETLQIE